VAEAIGRGERAARQPERSPVAAAVAEGLGSRPKWLPPWLFYDEEGSRLFEEITRLPEYYPTRAERGIFRHHARALVREAAAGWPLTIIELGAGSAEKSQILLRAAVAFQGKCTFVPVDVSPEPLQTARKRLAAEEPLVTVRAFAMRHEAALRVIRELGGRRLVLFIGSSIGNYDDAEARRLLRGIRSSLRRGDALLLGTDLVKDPSILVRAYDDARGVTAAFNKNVLVRINRELGGRFDPDRFRHVALWNAEASRIEMHLASVGSQKVDIRDLGLTVSFADGETIHTESSVKYTTASVDGLLSQASFRRESTRLDRGGRFAVHLARAA
jgi:dimethylhistidine N-methyltransferase